MRIESAKHTEFFILLPLIAFEKENDRYAFVIGWLFWSCGVYLNE